MHVYNRMGTANKRLEQLGDLTYGQSALALSVAVASATDEHGEIAAPVGALQGEFQTYLANLRRALTELLDDIEPFLNRAIDAVEQDNGTYEGVPATERTFVAAVAPIRIN